TIVLGHRIELGAQLVDFLGQLVEYRAGTWPVEADTGGAFLQLDGALPLRQAASDASQRAAVVAFGLSLAALVFFPGGGLRFGVGNVGVAKHMRMTALHLVA